MLSIKYQRQVRMKQLKRKLLDALPAVTRRDIYCWDPESIIASRMLWGDLIRM